MRNIHSNEQRYKLKSIDTLKSIARSMVFNE
jgi:hypothetical protein